MEEEKKVDVKEEVKDEKPVEVKTDVETKPEVKVETPVEKPAEPKEEYGSKETVLLCTLAVLAIFLFIIGCEHGEHRMQDSAVRHGAGEYYSDTTGHTHFRFIKAKEDEIEKNTIKTPMVETVLRQDTVEVKEEK